MKSQVTVLVALASAIALLTTFSTAQDPLRGQAVVPRSSGTTTSWAQASGLRSRVNASNVSNRLRDAQILLEKAESDDEKAKVNQEIKLALEEQFESDLKKRKAELKEIKERIETMEEQLDKRIAAKSEIIELRLQVMMNEANGLGWSSPSTGFRFPGVSGTSLTLPGVSSVPYRIGRPLGTSSPALAPLTSEPATTESSR